jgi:hypothetical protein
LTPLFLFLAFMLSVRSSCGDDSTFIGARVGQAASTSCAQ